MALQKLPTILVTEEHLLIGEVQTGDRRLLETLVDPTSQYLLINDAHVTRRESKTSKVATLKEVVIRKNLLCMAVLGGGQHEAPERRRFAFVDKQTYSAFLIVSGYEIEGRVQLKGAHDPVSALAYELKSFIPVTHAKLSHAGGNGEPLAASVVFCNREFVSAFHLGEELAAENARAISSAAPLQSSPAR